MKALVLQDYLKFTVTEVPQPEIGPEEVLIAVKACGICGSDVHGMDGSTGRRRPPIIMGHEAAGVIAATGGSVTNWKAGDRVTFDSTIYCGKCEFCRRGQVNLCNHRRVLGVSCEDYRQQGAFAEFVAVPQHILYKLPDSLSFEHAALIEPFSIAFHAVRRTSIALNDSSLVLGCGMIGLALIQTLRLAGCGRIIAVDVASDKLAMARQMGASHTINSSEENPLAQILALTNNTGVALAFEAVGIDATLGLALRSVRKGGQAMLVGNLATKVDFPLQFAVTRELTIYGSCASVGEYPACLDLIASGALQVAPFLSASAPLAEGAAWFDRLYRKEPGLLKVILTP